MNTEKITGYRHRRYHFGLLRDGNNTGALPIGAHDYYRRWRLLPVWGRYTGFNMVCYRVSGWRRGSGFPAWLSGLAMKEKE